MHACVACVCRMRVSHACGVCRDACEGDSLPVEVPSQVPAVHTSPSKWHSACVWVRALFVSFGTLMLMLLTGPASCQRVAEQAN